MNFMAVPSFFQFLKALTFYKLVVVVGAVELWKVCCIACCQKKKKAIFRLVKAVENLLRKAKQKMQLEFL